MDRNKRFTMNKAVQMSSSNCLIKCPNRFICLLYTLNNVYNWDDSEDLAGFTKKYPNQTKTTAKQP